MEQCSTGELNTTDELKKRLLHSDRLAAVGQLAAGVAHQINNPVAFIQANLLVLEDCLSKFTQFYTSVREYTESEFSFEKGSNFHKAVSEQDIGSILRNAKDILRENLDGIERIRSLVKDLRVFSRSDDRDVELVKINEIAETACNIAFNEIRHRARLSKEFGKTRLLVGNRGKLTQVFTNLLVNGAHAIDEGSADRNLITISTQETENNIVISVKDTGSGIPMAVQNKIFEAFFTTKSREHGTGLGLTLSKEIVSSHRGAISFESIEGQGTSFNVTLPFDTGLVLPEQRADHSRAAVTPSGVKILIIDDEPIILKSYRRMLSQSHEVVIMEKGSEALELLKNDCTFDVIICDLMMPDTDAVMIFDVLREVKPELLKRFVFHSGGAFTDRVKNFMNSVQNQILEKPVTKEQLNFAIAQICNSLTSGSEETNQ